MEYIIIALVISVGWNLRPLLKERKKNYIQQGVNAAMNAVYNTVKTKGLIELTLNGNKINLVEKKMNPKNKNVSIY